MRVLKASVIIVELTSYANDVFKKIKDLIG
jgi:hypothetical protein